MAASCQVEAPTQDINILLLGRIGQGKSATGNSVLRNKNFETSNHSSSATTKHVQWSSGEHTTRGGKRYMLNVADGPGLQDTELSNAQDKRRAYQNIERVIQESESGIHAFILVIRLGVRFAEEEGDTVNYLKRVLGEQFLKKYGIIAVTHGDSLDDGDDDSQGKLNKFQQWWKQQGDLIELCDRCVLFNNNTKDEHTQIEQLVTLLEIIEGMLQRNKDSPYTTKMFQTFAEDQKKLKAEFHIEFVKEEFRRHLNNVWYKIEHITNMNSLNRSISALDALLKKVQFENKETNISDPLQKDLEGLQNLLIEMKQNEQRTKNEKDERGTGLFRKHSADAGKMILKIAYRASYKTGQKNGIFDRDYKQRYYESLDHGSRGRELMGEQGAQAQENVDDMDQSISSKKETNPLDVELDQGYPEVEMFQEESDLHQRRDECKKNPGHLHFIPVANFNIEHLPEGHREQLCLDYVKAVIDLTVKLAVDHVSSGRPSKEYPLSGYRGKNPRAVGSGMVEWMHRKFTDEDGQTCPCRTCKKLPARDRKKQWGKFGVVTAKHVVHDHKESIETEIYVDYDNDTDLYTCPKLYGAGVRESVSERGGYDRDLWKDECEVYIVSHDRNVCSMLEERIERYGDLHEKVKNRGNRGSSKRHIVCVSHPHGMSKHVSVGEFLGENKDWPFNWSYTTPTCSGSSGAPVFRLGEKWDLYTDTGYMTYHSGACQDTGANKSGRYGWWR